MNKINLIVANNLADANKAVISKIDIKDLTKKNLVIVPDRFSLLCERLIFETLGIDAYFNIEVMGVSGLARQVFEHFNKKFEYVDKLESKIIIRKAFLNVQNKLCCFLDGVTPELIDLIFNAIVSFKTNKVSPEDVLARATENNFLSAKLKDLSLIFFEYERILAGRLDGSNVLTKLEELAAEYDFSSHNLFYVNFDGFTKQANSVMAVIAKTANSLVVGTALSSVNKNSYIFDSEIYDGIIQHAEKLGVCVQVEEVPSSLNNNQKFLHENLFALEKNKQNECGFVRVLEANTIKEEVLEVAKIIKKLVVEDGVKFNQINVACGGLQDYKGEIENVFVDFGINHYIDTCEKLAESDAMTLIINVLNILADSNAEENFVGLVFSTFSGYGKETKTNFASYIEKYGKNFLVLKGQCCDEQLKNEFSALVDFFNTCENKLKEKNADYFEIIESIIQFFELPEQIEKRSAQLQEMGYIKESKFLDGSITAINKMLEAIKKGLGQENIAFKDFLDILIAESQEIDVSAVPLTADSVFVGDITSSFFAKADYLFVVGASSTNIPKINSDVAILNDDILEKIKDKIILTPTVKMINRRNRFKVFGELLNFSKQLIVCYSLNGTNNEKQLPSIVVKDLLEMFGTEILISISGDGFMNIAGKAEADQHKIFAQSVGTKEMASVAYVKNLAGENPFLKMIMPTLKKIFGEKNSVLKPVVPQLKLTQEQTLNQLFFVNNKTKISQVEKFYECPFKHFVQYGLKLKENLTPELNTADVGIFLHKIAEEFLSKKNNYIEQISAKKIKINEILNKIIKKIEKNNKFYKFLLKENQIAKNLLIEEAASLCEYLYKTFFKSKFKPTFLELYFGGETKYEFNVGDKKFNLVGVVDRVDVYQDMFTVIDYKSGTGTLGNSSELWYGEKIQTFAYAKAIAQLKNLKPCGVYYFPISNEFKEDSKNRYKLRGKSVMEENFLSAMDTSLSPNNPKSEIFSCDLRKEVGKDGLSYNLWKSGERRKSFDEMCDYAINMIKHSISQVLSGNISVSPIEGACGFCPYKAICQKNKNQAERKKLYEVTSESFENEE